MKEFPHVTINRKSDADILQRRPPQKQIMNDTCDADAPETTLRNAIP
jgi:hypothetical protein